MYFVQNRISRISGLSCVGQSLVSLELGGNRIRVSYSVSYGLRMKFTNVSQTIENLEALENLEELWLGKNKITKLEVRSVYSPLRPD